MRMLQVLAAMTAVLGLAACSSSGDSEEIRTTSSSAAVSPEPSTTTSVIAPTSTSTSSSTVVLSDEEQVLAVFNAYMGFEFDERANGYGPSEERVEQYTTGALKQRALETLQARKDADAFLEGTASIRVENVTVRGDEADLLACVLDSSVAFFEDGSIADDPEDEAILVRYLLGRSDGSWTFAEQVSGGEVACEL